MAVDLSDGQGEPLPSNVPVPSGSAARAGLTEQDVEVIADRVYRLMMSDIRLALARGERPPGGVRRES